MSVDDLEVMVEWTGLKTVAFGVRIDLGEILSHLPNHRFALDIDKKKVT